MGFESSAFRMDKLSKVLLSGLAVNGFFFILSLFADQINVSVLMGTLALNAAYNLFAIGIHLVDIEDNTDKHN
jgi:hypothetical protein